MRFDGKVAIVTGAASGIGRAAAQRLAAEGAFVALAEALAARGHRVEVRNACTAPVEVAGVAWRSMASRVSWKPVSKSTGMPTARALQKPAK